MAEEGWGGVGHVVRAPPEAVTAPPEGSGAGGWEPRPFFFIASDPFL